MSKTKKKPISCPHCNDYKALPDTVRKHISTAHSDIVARRKQEKALKAKEEKKKRNAKAYLTRKQEASHCNSATKATNRSTKSVAKKTAAKSRTTARFVLFAKCQERDKIIIPLMGEVDPRTAFDCAHST